MVTECVPASDPASPWVLSEIVGAQVAWWQLGFGARRAVFRLARAGRVHPDPHRWATATAWAGQLLEAPWWWRLFRSSAAAVLLWVVIATLYRILADRTPALALAYGAAVVFPLTAGWSWAQARRAGRIRALAPEAAGRAALAGWARVARWLRLPVALFSVLLGVTAVTQVVREEWAAIHGCPAEHRLDPVVRDWWLAHGGSSNVRCPTGPSRATASGVRYTPWQDRSVVYAAPALGPMRIPESIFTTWLAHGGPAGRLGQPVDFPHADQGVPFLNFQRGAVTAPPGTAAHVEPGRYRLGRTGLTACHHRDRPCLTELSSTPGSIRLGWQYGPADAFNVLWWTSGQPGTHQVEVAGYRFALAAPRPGAVYGFAVQACDKRLFARSECTSYTAEATVVVPVGNVR